IAACCTGGSTQSSRSARMAGGRSCGRSGSGTAAAGPRGGESGSFALTRGGELGSCGPDRRDVKLRARLGLADDQPLLIYVGRLDGEKKPDVVAEAFRKLPRTLGAKLALLGEGPLRDEIEALGDDRIVMPGYVKNRGELARWLAS